MPTPTYDLIDSTVLGSSATSITFSSIAATYRDLVLVINVIANDSVGANLFVNSDSGSNYNYVRMYGNGSSTGSDADSSVNYGMPLYGNSTPDAGETGIIIVQFLDYSATDKHKTILVRAGSVDGVDAIANRWASTSAINAFEVRVGNANALGAGTTFYLYGIAA